jgi:DNA-binding NarL/FixJ family response regulator
MQVLLHQETPVDVVFSDIDMPGAVDGFGLAKWIREHRPGLEVLLAGTIPRAVKSAKDLCEQGPVPKPYEAQVVHNHIRRLLRSAQCGQNAIKLIIMPRLPQSLSPKLARRGPRDVRYRSVSGDEAGTRSLRCGTHFKNLLTKNTYF